MTNSSPEIKQVLQEEEADNLTVDVGEIKDVVRVQQLPARHARMTNYFLDNVTANNILQGNKRRARAYVTATLTTSADSAHYMGVWIGGAQAVASGNAFLLPFGQVLPIGHAEKLYARAANLPGDTTALTTPVIFSVAIEDWAD